MRIKTVWCDWVIFFFLSFLFFSFFLLPPILSALRCTDINYWMFRWCCKFAATTKAKQSQKIIIIIICVLSATRLLVVHYNFTVAWYIQVARTYKEIETPPSLPPLKKQVRERNYMYSWYAIVYFYTNNKHYTQYTAILMQPTSPLFRLLFQMLYTLLYPYYY